MDSQAQTNTSASNAQLPEETSNTSSPEQKSSTHFQTPTKHQILSISSLVPSTVLTIIPICKPATTGSLYPNLSDVTSESQTPEMLPSCSASPDAQDQNPLTLQISCSGHPAEVQQRKPSDENPLEERSVGLILPKELLDEEAVTNSQACTTRELLALVGIPVLIIVVIASALIVKFLVFPSALEKPPPVCDETGSCSVPSQQPFLSKNPANQTGNITADCPVLVSDGRRIVGGTPAEDNSWGWQVSMQWRGKHVCGGAIISSHWVITAAHCFVENSMFEVGGWLIVVGTVKIGHNSPGKRYRALQILYHPSFNTVNNDYDVGLLRTITDIDMTGGVRPVCLPRPSESFPPGAACWITGWGFTNEGGAMLVTLNEKTKMQF